MNLSHKEQKYLLRLVFADLQRMNQLADHAIAHSCEVYLPDHSIAGDIVNYLIHDVLSNAGLGDAG